MNSKNRIKTNKMLHLVFFATLMITLLSGVTSLWLASQQELTEPQQRVLITFIAICQTGCCAIFGKTTDLLGSNKNDGN